MRTEALFSKIESLLPGSNTEEIGAFPLIDFEKVVVLCELVYEVSLAYYHEWNGDFEANSIRDVTLLATCFKSAKMSAHVQDVDKYDLLNLFHVNLVRALV